MPRFYELEGEKWVTSNAKRRLDVILASLSLPVAMPIAAAAIVASRLMDGRDTIFTQARVGQYGELFDMDKIRTMKPAVPGGEASTRGEITRLGKILRPLVIDEVPQLFDVLEGRMSLVGPRAMSEGVFDTMSQALDAATYSEWENAYYTSRPGGTSTHQITDRLGISNKSIPFDEQRLQLKASMDIEDFKSASFAYDLRLIGKTAATLLSLPPQDSNTQTVAESRPLDS
jgi:lipopolysaccharide/colanic/teichoic acid biosynthesis glycosyltransferase